MQPPPPRLANCIPAARNLCPAARNQSCFPAAHNLWPAARNLYTRRTQPAARSQHFGHSLHVRVRFLYSLPIDHISPLRKVEKGRKVMIIKKMAIPINIVL